MSNIYDETFFALLLLENFIIPVTQLSYRIINLVCMQNFDNQHFLSSDANTNVTD